MDAVSRGAPPDPTDTRRRAIARTSSGLLTLLSAIWSLWLLVIGGFSVTIGGFVIRSNAPVRPLLLSAVFFVVYLSTGGRTTLAALVAAARPSAIAGWQSTVRAWHAGVIHHGIAGAMTLALLVIGIIDGSTAASGSDSFGYLSEAELFLKGRVAIEQPWVSEVPWPNPEWGFAPLGYRPAFPSRFSFAGFAPAQDRWAIVPTYSPGLPMLMALGKVVGGACGPFAVIAIGGALLVLSTYLIGLRLGSRTMALLGTILVATSPPFLLMHFVNMTDVPVAGALAFACWCLLGTTLRSAVGAAVALAVALLIRPNLVPIVPLFVFWLGWRIAGASADRRSHIWRAAIVIVGAAAASVTTSVIYWIAYGTPFESGYGATSGYFAWSHVVPNARNYAQWFSDVHTPLGFLGLMALAVPMPVLWPDASNRSAVVMFAAMTATVIAMFLLYLVFDNSSYLRFFLVCYPFIMLGLAATALALARVHRVVGPVLTIAVIAIVVFRGLTTAREWHVLDQGMMEAKFADVAEHVRAATPENSVIIAMQQSGSLRYYAGRVTLRWDNLQADWFDRAVAWMAEHGVHTYAMLYDFELEQAVKHFKGQTLTAVLEGPPVFRFGNMRFFDLGLPPGTVVRTVELPVLDIPPRCWTPAPPPSIDWK